MGQDIPVPAHMLPVGCDVSIGDKSMRCQSSKFIFKDSKQWHPTCKDQSIREYKSNSNEK